MTRSIALLLSLLLLLTGATLAQDPLAIEGLGDEDLALLTNAGADTTTVHFDLALRLDMGGAPDQATEIALAGPAALGADDAGQPLMTMDLEGTTRTGAHPALPQLARLRLVENILYLRTSDEEQWGATDIAASLTGTGLPTDMSEVSGARAIDMLGWLRFSGLNEFATGERLADEAGQARFRIAIDLEAWLASPAFAQLLGMAGDASGDESLASMGAMMGMLLQDLRLVSDYGIDLDSGLMQRLALELGLSINPALLGGSNQAEPTPLTLSIALDDMRYNQPLEVSAPEAALVAPAA